MTLLRVLPNVLDRTGEFSGTSATSEGWHVQWRQTHRGNSRNPVAWVAFVEETKRMKPTDEAILGMVSESPGPNVSEPIGGLDRKESKGRAL